MIEVLDLSKKTNRKIYENTIKTFNSKRPYDSLDFISSFSDGFENLVCITYTKDDNDIVMLPGYLRKIELTNYYDFISPYGYSGLIYSKNTPSEVVKNGWNSIKAYLDENVISSFIRYALNTDYSVFENGIVPIMKNIKGAILDYDTQLENFDRKVRKNVRRAKSEGLITEIIKGVNLSENQLKSFYDIYVDTMKRNNADEKYYFSLNDFGNFAKNRGDLCAFCFIYDEDKPVSVEMVLQSDDSIFSFLGGTLSEAFSKRPNDFLKYALINWARDEGIQYFVLGGGYGSEDGIFKYKKTFFPNDVVDYCVGKFIHNEKVYDELTEKAKLRYLNQEDKTEQKFNELSFFPLYRVK